MKCTCITLYNHTVYCTKSTRAQSVRRQHRKRNSEKSEMVTYKYVTEVVRNRCDNHQARRVDSRAIVLLNAVSVGALIIWIIKQTNANIANSWRWFRIWRGISVFYIIVIPKAWHEFVYLNNNKLQGRRQSPINISPSSLTYDPALGSLSIDKQTVSGRLTNTGQSLVLK